MELDERFHLLKTGMTVLDLGAAPGSWLQYTSEKIGSSGLVVGIDLIPIEPIAANVKTLVHDITDHNGVEEAIYAIMQKSIRSSSESSNSSCSSESFVFDLVLSDIAPNTSGTRDIDQWRSLELGRAVLAIAKHHLKAGGTCVVKIFQGADFDEFLRETKEQWRSTKVVTVKASRDRSHEVYLVLHS
jgi:23S rRNA (uridine2552-2'-O)-methyltransferase